jgi:hypothetical protein
MAVNYDTPTKSARMAATILQIDANASPAFMEICSASYATVLVTVVFADPSFTESGGVITMAGAPKSGVASNTGTAAVARIKDGGGTTKVNNLTVAAPSGGDINLNNTSISSGQTVTLTSGTITHAT